jgi:hypothetical protein
MKAKALLVIAIALLLVGFFLGMDAISGRKVDVFGDKEEVNVQYIWPILGAGVGFLIAFGLFNTNLWSSRTAPPYLGRMGSMEKGEIDKTLEKSGEMKRIGGEY